MSHKEVITLGDSDDESDQPIARRTATKRRRPSLSSSSSSSPVEIHDVECIKPSKSSTSTHRKRTKRATPTRREDDTVDLDLERALLMSVSSHVNLRRSRGRLPSGTYFEGETREDDVGERDSELQRALALSAAAEKSKESTRLRKEQDEALKLSMAIDRSKEEAKAKAKRDEEEKQRAQKKAAEDREAFVKALREQSIKALGTEPQARVPGVLSVRLDIPGKKTQRLFRASDTAGALIHWVRVNYEEALRAEEFEVVWLNNKHRLSSKDPAARLDQPLSCCDVDKACLRVVIIKGEGEDEEE